MPDNDGDQVNLIARLETAERDAAEAKRQAEQLELRFENASTLLAKLCKMWGVK